MDGSSKIVDISYHNLLTPIISEYLFNVRENIQSFWLMEDFLESYW